MSHKKKKIEKITPPQSRQSLPPLRAAGAEGEKQRPDDRSHCAPRGTALCPRGALLFL